MGQDRCTHVPSHSRFSGPDTVPDSDVPKSSIMLRSIDEGVFSRKKYYWYKACGTTIFTLRRRVITQKAYKKRPIRKRFIACESVEKNNYESHKLCTTILFLQQN